MGGQTKGCDFPLFYPPATLLLCLLKQKNFLATSTILYYFWLKPGVKSHIVNAENYEHKDDNL